MNPSQGRVLVVENDPSIRDLVINQTLLPSGFQVHWVSEAASAIQDAARFSPDLVLANLNLPGLSGKDLLVAFSSQGLDIPVVVLANQVKEGDIIDAFRLGAADFITWPAGEAEVISVVERVLMQVSSRREKNQLALQLSQTNAELQRRVRELTTIYAMGKAVLSITDLRSLFEKIVEGAVFVAEADTGWLLFWDELQKNYVLSAGRHLPAQVQEHMHQAWDDGLSSLVSLSGEPLSIHGDPLKRFKVASLGRAALVVPVKVRNEVLALLVVMRKTDQAFSSSSQALLEAVADYASIAIVNARLFRALQDNLRSSQQTVDAAQLGERIAGELVSKLGAGLQAALAGIPQDLKDFTSNLGQKTIPELQAALSQVQTTLEQIHMIAASITIAPISGSSSDRVLIDFNHLVHQALQPFQSIVKYQKINLVCDYSALPVKISANRSHLLLAVLGLITSVIQNASQGGLIRLRVSQTTDNLAQLTIHDRNRLIPQNRLDSIFAQSRGSDDIQVGQGQAGFGVSLSLVQEIIRAHNGKVWVNSEAGKGSIFFVLLPGVK